MRSRLQRERDKQAPKGPKKGSGRGLTIEAIKDQVQMEDLVEHLGGHVPRVGSNWSKVSCPFHEDRTPSASIEPIEGRFRCHSCDTSGDVIDLAQKHLGTTDMREALAWLEATFLSTSP